MFCPKCGKECENNASFCTNCGYQFGSVIEQNNTYNRCPNCGEQIEIGIKKCPHCGEWVQKKNTVLLIVISVLVFIVLLVGIIFLIPLFMTYSPATENRSAFRKAYSALNQALTMNYALEDYYVNNPNQFVGVFNNRLNVTSKTEDSFTTADGIEYTIEPLKNRCGFAPSNGYGDENTACAKVIIDVNGKKRPNEYLKDRYNVYLYADRASVEYDSSEYSALNEY